MAHKKAASFLRKFAQENSKKQQKFVSQSIAAFQDPQEVNFENEPQERFFALSNPLSVRPLVHLSGVVC